MNVLKTTSNKFGIEHCNFRFQFTGEKPNEETALTLSGLPDDGVMINGWKVQPLRIPPVVSEQYNVMYNILYDTTTD